MNPEKTPELTVQTLMALRKESDAVRVITERLKVKEMGPADHIRTKHEVKAFVESGTTTHAEQLLVRARTRRETTQNLSQSRSRKLGQQI
ncbi:hypothetical protein [Oleiharenicola sp. Vm1]|uniref:hypothetical protein n=1 Tax=Oleiharenicola sp. Vm1 TaxID=3398393 RepID=UPI0039F54FD6